MNVAVQGGRGPASLADFAEGSIPLAVSLKLPLVVVDDADLVRVSRENPGYQFEREEDNTLTVTPNYTKGGVRSGEAYSQLNRYERLAGGQAFGSSVGFKIGRRGAVKSPDASWVSQPRIDAVTAGESAVFWRLSPDVAIEIKQSGEDFRTTVAKVAFYVKHGSRYAVAIDPETGTVVPLGTRPDGLSLDFEAIVNP